MCTHTRTGPPRYPAQKTRPAGRSLHFSCQETTTWSTLAEQHSCAHVTVTTVYSHCQLMLIERDHNTCLFAIAIEITILAYIAISLGRLHFILQNLKEQSHSPQVQHTVRSNASIPPVPWQPYKSKVLPGQSSICI